MLTEKKINQSKIIVNNIEFYTVDGLDLLQKEMLRLLKIINEIAIQNDISYWIDGGSLIGVLRHDGFIPWDDDLDISLLKEDYLKMIKCLSDYSKVHDDAYLFFSEPQSNHTCNFFASRTVFSRTEGSTMLIPAKVDIRPLNSIIDSSESLKENNVLRDTANILLFGKSYGYSKNIPKNQSDIIDFFYYYNNFYGLCNASTDNTLLVHPYFEFSSQFRLKYSDILPLTYHVFEDMLVPVPRNYHYIQTQLYGDYMMLPPLENRAPVACKIYKKTLSSSLYKRYIKRTFGYNPKGLVNRLRVNALYVYILGIIDYLRIKFHE